MCGCAVVACVSDTIVSESDLWGPAAFASSAAREGKRSGRKQLQLILEKYEKGKVKLVKRIFKGNINLSHPVFEPSGNNPDSVFRRKKESRGSLLFSGTFPFA